VVKLPKNVIKINIKKKKYIRVSRKRTVILPLKNIYKTNVIKNNILNYYNKSKKDLIKLELIINN